jgi:hypothetical protein
LPRPACTPAAIWSDQGSWAEQPPRRTKRLRRRRLAVTAAVAAVGMAAGAGGLFATGGTSAGATTATNTALSTSAIAAKVDPGLVDIVSTLGYQNAEAAGTGQVMTSVAGTRRSSCGGRVMSRSAPAKVKRQAKWVGARQGPHDYPRVGGIPIWSQLGTFRLRSLATTFRPIHGIHSCND